MLGWAVICHHSTCSWGRLVAANAAAIRALGELWGTGSWGTGGRSGQDPTRALRVVGSAGAVGKGVWARKDAQMCQELCPRLPELVWKTSCAGGWQQEASQPSQQPPGTNQGV